MITECYPRPFSPNHCSFAHNQLRGLSESGWEVKVLVPNGAYPPLAWRLSETWRASARRHIPDGWALDGICVQDLPYTNWVPSRLNRPFESAERIRRSLDTWLRSHDATVRGDVLLCQFALPYGAIVAGAARELGLRYVLQLRGDDVWVWPHRNPAARSAFEVAVSSADLVIAVSRSLIEEAEQLVHSPLQRAAVVPNGIRLDRFEPTRDLETRSRARGSLGLTPRDVVILCVGDAIVRKGWLDLLAALGDLDATESTITLLAACGSKHDIDLRSYAERLAPRLTVKVLGDTRGESLVAAHQAADIFCLASHWEGLSNAMLEAMASGLPVVTTAIAGHPEAVTEGIEGFLVPAKNPAALRQALAPLVRSPDLRRKMGAAARRRAEAIGNRKQAGMRLSQLLTIVRNGVSDASAGLLSFDPYAPANSRTGGFSVPPEAGHSRG